MQRVFARTAVAATAATTAVALAVTPAVAAPSGHIVQISSTSGQVHIVFNGNDLPSGTSLDPKSVQVRIDGRPVTATAVPVGTQPQQIERTVVLLIDTSGSMAGAGITGAKAAANAFLSAVPNDVKVGLVAFSDKASVAVAPTTDRGALRTAIAKLNAHGETALYDGIKLAVSTVGTSGARTIVLLSDGGDTVSKTKLPQVTALLKKQKPTTLDAVAFNTSDAQSGVLAKLAKTASGRVITAKASSELAGAFKEVAHDVSNGLVVTATVPKDLGNEQATVEVDAKAGNVLVSDFASVYLAKGIVPNVKGKGNYGAITVPTARGFFHSKKLFYTALGALFAGLLVLFAVAFIEVNRDRSASRFSRRLSLYTLGGRRPRKKQETTVIGDSAVAQSAMEWAGRMVAKHNLETRLGLRLEAAGLPMKPAEWLLIHAGITIGAGLVFLLATGINVIGLFIGLAVGAIGAWMFLDVKKSRRTAAFMARMPDTLQLMAGSLSAGYSLPQAVDTVVRDGAEPISGEFKRALVEARLGVALEDALEGVGERMHSKDFGWVVMAIRIQREVGGNLAELLSTVAATLRERDRLRRQVRVLSAEGRLSAAILFGLPVVFAIYLLLVRPSYLRPLYHDHLGWAMLVVLAVLLTIGFFWLRKVVKVEV